MDLPDTASRWLPTMSSFRGRTSLRRMCQDWPSSRMCRDFNSAWSVQQSPPPPACAGELPRLECAGSRSRTRSSGAQLD